MTLRNVDAWDVGFALANARDRAAVWAKDVLTHSLSRRGEASPTTVHGADRDVAVPTPVRLIRGVRTGDANPTRGTPAITLGARGRITYFYRHGEGWTRSAARQFDHDRSKANWGCRHGRVCLVHLHGGGPVGRGSELVRP